MKRLVIIVIFFLISRIETIAQYDFRNGYIINNNNDTAYGLIDYKGNKANAKKCIYRIDIDSENQEFTPNEIRAYRFIDSKYYITKSVINNNDTIQLFLEYLINGVVDIYYYRDHFGDHYLVGTDSNNLDELKHEEKEIFVGNDPYIKETKEYIGILRYTFKESPTISKKVENIELNHKSLIEITHDYHNEICSGEECIIYEKNLPKRKRYIGIIIGINDISVSQTGKFTGEPYYLNNSQFEINIFPSIGLYYKLNMPFVNERLYFQNEFTYSHINLKTSNSYIDPGSETSSEITYLNVINLTQNTFNYLGFIEYEFPKRKIKPTFQFGTFAKYSFKTDYNRDIKMTYTGGKTYTTQTNDNPFDNYDFGVNLGLGFNSIVMKDKEIFVDFRYQRGFGLFKGLNTNTYLISLGFQI
jgi:hypothetical protein